MTEHNTHPGNTYSYAPGFPPPAPKKQAWFKKPIVFIPMVAAVVAFGLGSGTASANTETVEVIKEVPGPVQVETKTETVNVPTTPAECLTYIDLSEQAFDYSAEAMGYMASALEAAGNFDVASLEAASADLSTVNPKLKALTPDVNASKAACRAAQ